VLGAEFGVRGTGGEKYEYRTIKYKMNQRERERAMEGEQARSA